MYAHETIGKQAKMVYNEILYCVTQFISEIDRKRERSMQFESPRNFTVG